MIALRRKTRRDLLKSSTRLHPVRERLRRPLSRAVTDHHPGPDPDIAIVSSPRTGSTWLMEALTSQPGYKLVNEPDHPIMLQYHGCLSFTPRWNWLWLDGREKEEYAHFLLTDEQSGLFGPVRPRDWWSRRRTTRRVLKFVRMNALIEWVESIGLQPVYLIRHPIPVALSCIKRRHVIRLGDFLAEPHFARLLTAAQIREVQALDERGDCLAQFVAQWCLENLVPLRSRRVGSHIPLSAYEWRLLDQEGEARRLADALDVPDADRMAKYARRPSRVTDTTPSDTKLDISSGHAHRLISRWHRDVSPKDERRLMGIVECFEIDAYRMGDDLPTIQPNSSPSGSNC